MSSRESCIPRHARNFVVSMFDYLNELSDVNRVGDWRRDFHFETGKIADKEV